MAQPGSNGVPGPAGRKLHIAHRRSPSELTPLMMEQLALQQQIELLQQQQQQIAATHQQYVNMGMLPQQMAGMPGYAPAQPQGLSPPTNNFQFPQMQQNMGMGMNPPSQPGAHRRNQSALPSMAMGPPPAPSAGASGSQFSDYNQQAMGQNLENSGAGRGRGGPTGGGHTRRHSLALPEAKKAAELAEKKRATAGFQFPIPGSAGGAQSPDSSTAEEKPQNQSSGQGLGLQRAGNARIVGHGRSQSMAVGGARGGGAAGRGGGSFQFPGPVAGGDSQAAGQNQADMQRRGSQGHGRSQSRNFDGNWRQQPSQQQAQDQQPQMGQFGHQQNLSVGGFQPGHRARGSVSQQSVSSMSGFSYPGQPQLMQMPQGQMMMQPQMFGGQQLNALQIAQLQAMQGAQLGGLQASQHAPQLGMQNQQQAQRKTLFTPYLPQASLPALLNDGQLVAGILRVNKKNRSDAYVTTNDLDADIFICGSKDRNRALEGDLVAIELLDVDEVWGQKREKEEKKKRKDITDTRGGNKNDSGSVDSQSIAPDGSIRRRGSLRQRPTQKKNDDVEVEGQSLLLMEEEEISDDAKPLYAGHVVAVIERVAGQMFSGTLGLLRPSSQATKEKQDAERQARDGHGRNQHERQQDKPKIVWFKPTDKRVPLIAIPTEQAPRDFVEKHQDYANRIFVACIKRWPITSLHPFGTLVEQLGEMGDPRVETDALLRDNNFGSDEFSDAVLKSVGWEDWSVETESEATLADRRDLRNERIFTIDPNGSKELDDAIHVKQMGNGKVEVGIHVTDVAYFIKSNSLVDREAKKRGTGVYLVNRAVNMLPPRLSAAVCSLLPEQSRLTVSVIFEADTKTGKIEGEPWIGRSIIKSSGKLTYDQVDAVMDGNTGIDLQGATAEDIQTLQHLAGKFREGRFGNRTTGTIPALRLLHQLDDENVPVEQNIFSSSAAHEIIEEISHKANFFVAQKLFAAMPDKALLRRQAPPNPRRLITFAERMAMAGYEIDPTSSGSLQSSLFNVSDSEIRKGMETLLVKTLQRAKYYLGNQLTEEQRQHFTLNLPVYTHFTNPTRRYADIVVHRQLEAALSDGAIEFSDDLESLAKTTEQCNNKKDSAQAAQEQSVHIESCRLMDKKSQEVGGDLISEGIVICVYESAFDVLIPEYGFEKRVHCDQLPLKKAEFRKDDRVLELYWEKGVPSSAYVPEDERPKGQASTRGPNAAEAARERAKERYEAQRKQPDTGTMSTDAVDALFDDDDSASEIAEMTSGVSLTDRSTHSMPSSPTRSGREGLDRTRSDSRVTHLTGNVPESKLTDKQKYMSFFKLREEGGEYIQDVTEMTRVPVILKTDLTKSPPCLTIRSVNPYAL